MKLLRAAEGRAAIRNYPRPLREAPRTGGSAPPAGIVVHLASNGEAQTGLVDLGSGQPRSWSLQHGNLIYAASDDRGSSMLWRLDIERGTRQRWVAAEPGTAGPNITVSADFETAIVSRIDRLQADLLRVPAPNTKQ